MAKNVFWVWAVVAWLGGGMYWKIAPESADATAARTHATRTVALTLRDDADQTNFVQRSEIFKRDDAAFQTAEAAAASAHRTANIVGLVGLLVGTGFAVSALSATPKPTNEPGPHAA